LVNFDKNETLSYVQASNEVRFICDR